MRRLATVLCVPLLLSVSVAARSQQPNAAPPKEAPSNAAKQAASPSFIDQVLSFLGISDSPGTLKGPGDEVTNGELWVLNLDSQTKRAVAQGGHYRSPVFFPGGNEILALSGNDVVRLSLESRESEKLLPAADISKLIAFSSAEPDKVLILQPSTAGRHSRVGLLSVKTAKVTALSYNPASNSDLQMVENLEGWTRTYGAKQVFVRRQSKQTLSGTVEWSDIFLQDDSKEPRDVSLCDGANCGQPSLSADGRLLVFVKAPPE
jgi:Tol biopolymer transport system component